MQILLDLLSSHFLSSDSWPYLFRSINKFRQHWITDVKAGDRSSHPLAPRPSPVFLQHFLNCRIRNMNLAKYVVTQSQGLCRTPLHWRHCGKQDSVLIVSDKSVHWSSGWESKINHIPFFYLSILFLALRLFISWTTYPSLEKLHFVIGQGLSEGTEEALVVNHVVDHKQDSSQQLIGHKQVMQVRPLVVCAAVAATPLHQGPEVILVPGCKFTIVLN